MRYPEGTQTNVFDIDLPITAKSIGGFFELELPLEGSLYHDAALALANGRVCFKILLRRVQPTKVYVPYYACDTLISPLMAMGVAFEYYAINSDFEPLSIPALASTELFVFVNYFGMKSQFAHQLSKQLGEQLVIDNTQAFFEESFGKTWAFNSVRKFFGVPDGGFLYSPFYLNEQYAPNTQIVINHLWLKLNGEIDEANDYYIQNEESQTSEMLGMSTLSKRILYGVNFSAVSRLRKRNFRILDRALQHLNQLPRDIFDKAKTLTPFCYPLMLVNPIDKSQFYNKNIFIPTLWNDVLQREIEGFDLERNLAENLLPIPIDHRLSELDLRRIINFIASL
jgi:hypothetical protein